MLRRLGPSPGMGIISRMDMGFYTGFCYGRNYSTYEWDPCPSTVAPMMILCSSNSSYEGCNSSGFARDTASSVTNVESLESRSRKPPHACKRSAVSKDKPPRSSEIY